MKRVRLLFIGIAALGTLVVPAGAEPYWIAYEGNDFPENEGWERTFCDPNGVVGQGGAIRTIEDGALVLDSRESTRIVDFYDWSRPVDPGSDETFIMRWRLRVDDVPSTYPYDVSAGVFSDGYRVAAFALGESEVKSIFEPDLILSYEAGVYHTFEFRSSDMLSYTLLIDDTLTMTGDFYSVFEASRVTWGDGVQGASSLSHWDFLEFGVVPEPSTSCLLLLTAYFFVNHKINGDRK